MATSSAAIPGPRRAAILMVVLGEEAASAICRKLPDSDVANLTREIAQIPSVSPDLAATVLQDYSRFASSQDQPVMGGKEYARNLLRAALGPQAAEKMLQTAEVEDEPDDPELASLKKADTQQLSKLLGLEHPQTGALVLAQLEPQKASAVLMQLPDSVRGEVILRVAQMQQFSPEILRTVSMALVRRLKPVGADFKQKKLSGLKSVADLLNRMENKSSQTILEQIEASDPNIALGIRNLLFTFNDLLSAPDASIRELVGVLDKKLLATALKGAADEVKQRFFKAMSSRAVDMMKEDMDAMGPIRSRDVIQAQQEAITIARKLESQGKISLRANQDDEYVV